MMIMMIGSDQIRKNEVDIRVSIIEEARKARKYERTKLSKEDNIKIDFI